MKINLIRALLLCGVLSGLTTARSVQANPVVIGPAAKFIAKAAAETATGLVVSESYETLKQALAGPPAVKALSASEIIVGLHAYDEYDMVRNGKWKNRDTRRVTPNPATGFLDYHHTSVTIDTNTLAEAFRTEDHTPFDFGVRDLYDSCGSSATGTQRIRSITTLLAARHQFRTLQSKPPAYFTFNLLLAHTATGAQPNCVETARPIPDGTYSIPVWVLSEGYRIFGIPAAIYPNIVTYLSISQVGAQGGTTVSY